MNGICLNRLGINRCNKVINKEAFRFIPEKKSHIVIPNIDPNSLNLNFIVMINNVDISSPILSTSNNSWRIGIEDKKFCIYTIKDNKLAKIFSENLLKSNKIYEVILRVFNDTLSISLDKRILTIPIEKRVCSKDDDCGNNGFCERSSTGSNYCSYNRIDLHLGRNGDTYFDGFIGDIFLNFDKNEEKVLTCDFNSKDFKNRRICLEECNRSPSGNNPSCDRICSNVQKCEFEPSGRHSEDCIQLCMKNDDCDSDHCNNKCRKCGSSCPWNDSNINNKFDSDYNDNKGRPSPPRISIMNISSDGKKVLLRWKPPYKGNEDNESEDPNDPDNPDKFRGRIKGYISYLYKTFNKGEGVKINNISAKCNDFCEYVLDGVNPSETYTIGIKGYNYFGLGKCQIF